MYNCLVMQKEEQIIDHILAEMGDYYDAESVCIYEVNKEYTLIISSRNEWCSEGAVSIIGSQHNLSQDGLKQWFEWLFFQNRCITSEKEV